MVTKQSAQRRSDQFLLLEIKNPAFSIFFVIFTRNVVQNQYFYFLLHKHEVWNTATKITKKLKYSMNEIKVKFPLAPMGVLAPGSAHVRPSARPPIDTSGNFTAPMSEESPSNISPNPSEVISDVSEPYDNFWKYPLGFGIPIFLLLMA